MIVLPGDKRFDNEKNVFNTGDKSFSIGLRSEDYVKLVRPITTEII